MAVHDYILANQSGSSFRSDLNNALAAIVSQNSNATEPATKYAYQYWVDTSATPALIKQRNAANDAWVTLAEVDGQTLAADGTNAKPGISFAADIDTGLKRNAANDLSIVTNGTQAITVDSSQNVGIGTTSFTRKLEVVTGTGIAGFKQSSSSLATTLEFLRNGVGTATNNAIEVSNSAGIAASLDYGGGANFTDLEIQADAPKIRLHDTDTFLSDGELSSAIEFYQSDNSGAGVGASIVATGDGSTGALALEFSTGADDLRFKIFANGTARFLPLAGTGNRALFVAASGSLTTSSSDASMKTNVTTLGSQLEVVKQLNPVSYNWIDTEERGDQLEIGFIAQELQPLVPEVIGANSDETLTVDYSKLTAVLTKGLQEALTKIETLETKVAALEAAN
jgi:hypothetical protein|tara:strand:+ start:789 stop:1976 length:1188 start_codon:yes stop_codon:yes gene_type:complete